MNRKRRFAVTSVLVVLALSISTAAFASFRANAERPWFVAQLSGTHEVPPVASDASGLAFFHYDEEHDAVRYRIKVKSLEGVVAAHVHHAPAGQNGGVVATLLQTMSPPAGSVDGVLVTGFITADDVTGDFDGDWQTFVRALFRERLYVNIHTVTNPSGELRGQIVMKGPHGPTSPPASRPAPSPRAGS